MTIEEKITEVNGHYQKAISDLNNLQRLVIQLEGALIVLNQLKAENDKAE